MAENVLTGLIPDIHDAMDVISRELVGLIPAVSMNINGNERAALNDDVTIPLTPAGNGSNITPAMTVPDPTGQTIGNIKITMTKARTFEFGFVGEGAQALGNAGTFRSVQSQMIGQAIRGLVNEIEADLAGMFLLAGRAFGVAATTPFGSNLSDMAQAHKVLVDGGAPTTDKQIVIDTTAGANVRSLTNLTNVNNAGTPEMLREGIFGRLTGFAVRESAAIVTHTAGTGSSATTDAAGYAIGATVITLASAGTGTILVGDVIVFAGDATKYVVKLGDADVSNGGTITLNGTGLAVAIPAGATAITLSADYVGNMAFDRGALHLLVRAPALVNGRDSAVDRITITDPTSGLSLEFAVYEGYKKTRFEVAAVWGFQNIKPEHSMILLG